MSTWCDVVLSFAAVVAFTLTAELVFGIGSPDYWAGFWTMYIGYFGSRVLLRIARHLTKTDSKVQESGNNTA